MESLDDPSSEKLNTRCQQSLSLTICQYARFSDATVPLNTGIQCLPGYLNQSSAEHLEMRTEQLAAELVSK